MEPEIKAGVVETTEDKLKKVAEERKALREQLAKEKLAKKAARTDAKSKRDGEIERIGGVVDAVQKEIFNYNRLGKAKKMEANILSKIAEIVKQ